MAPRSKAQNQAQREETRRQIIMTAFKAFAEKGYSSASMSYIAKEAGISKGLSYHYFSSKEEILQGIIEMLFAVGEGIEDMIKGKNPKDQLRFVVEMTFEYFVQNTDTVRFMTALALQPEVMHIIENKVKFQKAHGLKHYEGIFEKLGYDNAYAEAYAFGALLDGAGMGFLTLGDDYPLEDVKQKILTKYDL